MSSVRYYEGIRLQDVPGEQLSDFCKKVDNDLAKFHRHSEILTYLSFHPLAQLRCSRVVAFHGQRVRFENQEDIEYEKNPLTDIYIAQSSQKISDYLGQASKTLRQGFSELDPQIKILIIGVGAAAILYFAAPYVSLLK